MTFPNVAGKHAHDPVFQPDDFLSYLRQQGQWTDFPIPDGVLLFYQRWFLDRVVADEGQLGRLIAADVPPSLLTFKLVRVDNRTLGLSGGFGIGSPAAAAIMEELIAVGVKRFIGVGTAGALQPDLSVGDIVVCDRAIRDEGVSHHYAAPAKYVRPSNRLTDRLVTALREAGSSVRTGPTWTIDAPYRETIEELRQYQSEGVLTVDMEAAALATIAEYRRVEYAAAFVVSDSLADLVWNPRFRHPAVAAGLSAIYGAATASLT